MKVDLVEFREDIVSELVLQGYIKDFTDTSDETEDNVSNLIDNIIIRHFGIEEISDEVETTTPDPETISIRWSVGDILEQAREKDYELTKEQALDILSSLKHNHDSSVGINWDVINEYIFERGRNVSLNYCIQLTEPITAVEAKSLNLGSYLIETDTQIFKAVPMVYTATVCKDGYEVNVEAIIDNTDLSEEEHGKEEVTRIVDFIWLHAKAKVHVEDYVGESRCFHIVTKGGITVGIDVE